LVSWDALVFAWWLDARGTRGRGEGAAADLDGVHRDGD